MRLGAKIFGTIAGILIVILGVGLLLPGTWEAEVEARLPAPPAQVFPYLNATDRWVLWNPMPESGSRFVGPPSGVGAGIQWDDPQYGQGEFRIRTSDSGRRVDYVVGIEDGALVIHGSISLSPEGEETRLRWREEGDFGWNPLLGFAARRMGTSQAEVMRGKLDALLGLLGEA